MDNKILILDSTLRDGAQGRDISFSLQDKINITMELDRLGITYIEAGNPASNPKDLEFFEKAATLKLKNASLVAFGSTMHAGNLPEKDENLLALISAKTDTVAIFGKSWDFHVKSILKISKDENLSIIKDSISFLKSCGKKVIYDAEHFFDGYRSNSEYALKTLEAAIDGGADFICLCDTNGGAFPDEITSATKIVCEKTILPVGIHAHNDGGMAVANSISAVSAGAVMVQGTFLGIGERCGNANLSTVIANLQLKKGKEIISKNSIKELTQTARAIAEISNVSLSPGMPYVGKNAFSHKGGMHIDAVIKKSSSFEHIPPEEVGNRRKLLISEVAGKSTVLQKLKEIDPLITKNSPSVTKIVQKLKKMEQHGYQFEGADGSFTLLAMKSLDKYTPFFTLENFKIIGEQEAEKEGGSTSAMIKVMVGGKTEITAAEGNGPVNALDNALRKALEVFYPSLTHVHLTDYKVRVLDSKSATKALVRVLIESTDGVNIWSTVGVSPDIIEASWIALADSIEYKLLKDSKII